VVDAEVDDAVGQARVTAVLCDDEQRGRLLAAPVAPGGLCGSEALDQSLGELEVCVALERRRERADRRIGDEDVPLGRVGLAGAPARPVEATRARERRRAALPVDDADLPVGAALVRGR